MFNCGFSEFLPQNSGQNRPQTVYQQLDISLCERNVGVRECQILTSFKYECERRNSELFNYTSWNPFCLLFDCYA